MSARRALVRKELIAQSTAWLVAAAGLLLPLLPGMHRYRDLALPVYMGGAAALGALAFGHEYRFRTLSQLLAQPIARGRIFAVKLTVLAALLAGLAALSIPALGRAAQWETRTLISLVALPPVYALFVAPWLTIKTRSGVAGTLFTASLGAMLVMAGHWLAYRRDLGPGDTEALVLRVVWTGSVVWCLAGAAGIWRAVTFLDVVEGPGRAIVLPPLLTRHADAGGRRHYLVSLVAKEIRLQQLTFMASMLYVAFYVTFAMTRTDAFPSGIMIATYVNGVVVAALIGSLSLAEERSLGTHEWQLLQPVSSRVQFAVKVAVAMALTLALAFGVPAILSSTLGGLEPWPQSRHVSDMLGLALFLAGSMFLSSATGSGLTALLLCVPSFLAVLVFVDAVLFPITSRIFVTLHRLPTGHVFVRSVGKGGHELVLAGLAAIVLWFAFTNSRAADRSAARALTQAAIVALLFTALATALAVSGRML